MSKKIAGTPDKVQEIPEGMPFVQLRLDLIGSPAWHGQSINCRRLIEFLLIQHMHNGGLENGNLLATYDQLVAFGISRKSIQPAITEAEQRGLIRVERGGRKKFAETHLSRFTLTFYKVRQAANEWGQRFWVSPSDDWKRYRPSRPSEIVFQGDEREPSQCPNGNFDGSRLGTVEAGKVAEICAVTTVPKREPPYISWPPTAELAPAEQQSENAPADLGQQQPIEAKRQRGTRIPDGAVLSDEARDFALGEGHPDPMREWADFTDYWKAQPGQKGVKLDWEATWRRWVRKAVDDGKRKAQRSGGGHRGGGDAHASLFAAGARLAARCRYGPR